MIVDPITQEVVRNRLASIADEMEHTLLRAAYSAIVKEGLDASSAIFDISGNNIAQAASIPIHLGCMIPAAETVVRKWPKEEMRDGDIYILNDPYDGGTHLPDVAVLKPIFVDGQAVALAATMSHHQEMGGIVAGSLPPTATSLFQEGLQISPMKLVDAGRDIEQVYQFIQRNVRTPDIVMGDLRAQIAACNRADRRIKELAEEIPIHQLAKIMDALLTQSERLVRERISKLPDGSYSFEDFMDDDGVDIGKPVRFFATVTIHGDQVKVDFTGSSKQLKGPFNCVPASSIAAVYYVLRAITGPDIPNNSGCYRNLEIILPEGSIVNPRRPAPVNSRTAAVRRICDVLIGCFSKVDPQMVPAASCGQLFAMNFGGVDSDTGQQFIMSDLSVGGMGGRYGMDGIDAIETDATNCMNIPAETMELESPVRVLQWSIESDTAGAGKWRGGCGIQKVFTILEGEVTANYRGERHLHQPWGAEGGNPASLTSARINRENGDIEDMPSKCMIDLRAGDSFELHLSGGGGYGDPLERPTAEVLEDVLNLRVSENKAAADYGVKITGREVDEAITSRLREKLAKERTGK